MRSSWDSIGRLEVSPPASSARMSSTNMLTSLVVADSQLCAPRN